MWQSRMIWMLGLVFLASVLLTGLLRSFALKRNLIDHPNERSSHTAATPRGGGLAIVALSLIAVLVTFLLERLSLEIFIAIFLGSAMVAGIGYWDDHGHVSPPWRLLVHFTAAGLALFSLGGFPTWQFGAHQVELGWFGYFFGILFLVWLLNLYNFMDGIDGIAGSEAIFVAGGACVIGFGVPPDPDATQRSLMLLQLILVAASFGFLFWNWPPAKIFLGDVGSGFLGFVLGILALCNAALGLLPLWSWLILLGVFIADATVTLSRRIFRRKPWYQAHHCHAYQHASRRWSSHRRVTSAILAINLVWLLPLAWLAAVFPENGWLITFFSLLPLILLAAQLGAGTEKVT